MSSKIACYHYYGKKSLMGVNINCKFFANQNKARDCASHHKTTVALPFLKKKLMDMNYDASPEDGS